MFPFICVCFAVLILDYCVPFTKSFDLDSSNVSEVSNLTCNRESDILGDLDSLPIKLEKEFNSFSVKFLADFDSIDKNININQHNRNTKVVFLGHNFTTAPQLLGLPVFKDFNAQLGNSTKNFFQEVNKRLKSHKNQWQDALHCINKFCNNIQAESKVLLDYVSAQKVTVNNRTQKISECRIKCPSRNNRTVQEETVPPPPPPSSCHEALWSGRNRDSVVKIRPEETLKAKDVWCNQTWQGGGWTVILRRRPQKVQLDFRRKMADYEEGFGDAEGEYWIGLKYLAALTAKEQHELAVLISIPDESALSMFSYFKVDNSLDYTLHVSGYDELSTAGDSLSYHDKMPFSTYDVDRDMDPDRSCSAVSGGGGFWYNYCYHTNPTGIYPPPKLPINTALHTMLEWRRWQGFYTYLSHLVFMIRPKERQTNA